jgi:hypothetical protein
VIWRGSAAIVTFLATTVDVAPPAKRRHFERRSRVDLDRIIPVRGVIERSSWMGAASLVPRDLPPGPMRVTLGFFDRGGRLRLTDNPSTDRENRALVATIDLAP